MTIIEFTSTMVGLAPSSNSNAGEATIPNPKPTVPSTTLPSVTITMATASSAPVNTEDSDVRMPKVQREEAWAS